MTEQALKNGERITRMVDTRIPLPWLMAVAGGFAWFLILMYFTLQQLVGDVADLKITVKAGNAAASTFTGQLELLKFRVENLETDRNRGGGTPPSNPPRR